MHTAQLLCEAERHAHRFEFERAHAFLDLASLRADVDLPHLISIRSTLAAQEGDGEQAYALAKQVVRLRPASRCAWANVLTTSKVVDISEAAFIEAHRVYAERFIHDEAHRTLAPPPRRDRRLRVGYFGCDGHVALSRFLGFVPSCRHESLFFYRDSAACDAFSALQPASRHVAVGGRGESGAQAVLAERLDIAVDFAGHGPQGWLDLLARRVAPVQITWLDYLATTGVPAIDFRLTDWIADPLGNDAFHVERLLRLPVAAWNYTPWPDAPVVRASGGGLVLGCANIPLKLDPATLTLWQRVLDALPTAELRLLGFTSARARERVLAAFHPSTRARVRLSNRLPPHEYLHEVSQFDVAMDTLRFSGGTSTLDCLWQGVRVVTMPGRLSHTRTSASLLGHVGQQHCVAACADEYIEIVTRLAADRQTVDDREALRDQLRGSALHDRVRFAAQFDAALEQAFDALVGEAQSNGLLALLEQAIANPTEPAPRRQLFDRLVARP